MDDEFCKKQLVWGRRLLDGCCVLVVVFLIGVIGFKFNGAENESWVDSFFMASITLTTVGFGHVTSVETNTAKIFTSIYCLTGMGFLLYVITTGTAFIVEGEAWELYWRRRVRKMVQQLNNHYIVCGIGRQGMVVANELKNTNRPFVMVEHDEERVKELNKLLPDVPVIEGDASENHILQAAGIDKAVGLIACLNDDKDNLMLVVTAKQMNKDLRIVCKGKDVQHMKKLSKAGADSVVSSTLIGGMRMASEMIRPSVVTFLDKMLRDKERTLRVEGVLVPKNSSAVGKNLDSLDINHKAGMVVVAIQNPGSDRFHYAPTGDTVVEEEITLIVVGDVQNIPKLEQLVA